MYITIKYLQHKGESNYSFKLQTQISIQMQPPKEKFSSERFPKKTILAQNFVDFFKASIL